MNRSKPQPNVTLAALNIVLQHGFAPQIGWEVHRLKERQEEIIAFFYQEKLKGSGTYWTRDQELQQLRAITDEFEKNPYHLYKYISTSWLSHQNLEQQLEKVKVFSDVSVSFRW